PTRCVLFPELLPYHPISSRLPAYAPVVPALAAYSHSASVGNLYFFLVAFDSLSQNSTASNQLMLSTGKLSPLVREGSIGRSIFTFGKDATFLHCFCVTSYLPI